MLRFRGYFFNASHLVNIKKDKKGFFIRMNIYRKQKATFVD